MSESLLPDERIGKILYENMDAGYGCPTAQYEAARKAIRQAVRETAEAAAKVCDGQEAEFRRRDVPRDDLQRRGAIAYGAELCAAEIRRRNP